MGQHPQIAVFWKGAYNLGPPKPRYSNTWIVSIVVTWLDSIDLKSLGLSLVELLIKTVLLLALYNQTLRSADLASFQLPNTRYRIAQNSGGENFGEFGETNTIHQYFTQPNYRSNELSIV